ncbi:MULTISPECIES: C40 family peptidase [Spirulina sp. CCY15215]|uniref:C40 family peptidase n=1 Tax=Spirulina sp. CCY15215 TaxID=2767591 RepID=UPI00195255AF|nr:C40 family peptidase [Spirulina major]
MSEFPFYLPASASGEYFCKTNLDLYTSPRCDGLATQAAKGRHLQVLQHQDAALEVCLCEDNYQAWLPSKYCDRLYPASSPYRPVSVSRKEIEVRIPDIIAFTKAAMTVHHHYLWGGTVSPHYDCSGLMQAAFAASGIWLPRDSYQQEAFTQKVSFEELLPGDLIFFKETKRVNHVALYLGEGQYIHSSGKDKGRNGIGIDPLSPDGGEIARTYYQYLFCAGRVFDS